MNSPITTLAQPFTLSTLLEQAEEIITDTKFQVVRNIKENKRFKAVGYFPVYMPQELIFANGILPVGLNGAGNSIEITTADAYFGSFICSIVKSTMELTLNNSLDVFDGLFFSGICDSARNLSFVIKRHLPNKQIHFFHFPHSSSSDNAIYFLEKEYKRMNEILQDIAGKNTTIENINRAISTYNTIRKLLTELYKLRINKPLQCSTQDVYLLTRLGNFILPDDYIHILTQSLPQIEEKKPKKLHQIKIVVEGAFCEQPPLDLLKIFDDIGFHLLDDDFIIGNRIFEQEVKITNNPFYTLAENYVKHTVNLSVKHQDKATKAELFAQKLSRLKPEAVIFLYAKFCEPGLFDYVIYKEICKNMNIPSLFIEFEEKMFNFDRIQLELEAFAESILF